MNSHKPIGILGGTFDPIHFGHLRGALEVWEALNFQEVRLVPCKVPVHRDPTQASPEQRVAMIELAISGEPALRVDTHEIHSDQPSYTVNTLQSLREEYGESQPLALIMGEDAFAELNTWHQWEGLIGLAHMVVLKRPGQHLPKSGEMAEFLTQHQGTKPEVLAAAPGGKIYVHNMTQLPISATDIRQKIAAGKSPRYLVPEMVWDYIKRQGLYL